MGTGAVNINNPLYVECKQECIKLFPYNETINVSEIEKINPFSSLRDKHDGIVLLVRPDGLKTFTQSFHYAEETKLKICYEPVDANWKLDLTKP